ncbi:D-alanyl-D-alanine carboxypeptidase-like protein [Chitinophaga skermanii]|uniref:D-alanyl-D-alanine carboxypeptidase-like protein n=1 Tax=Chitinophaga skermanii TaxID=331697 RepID=A0A327QCZ8_9BACT|nr:M15 family metallopeptidase [Chitinophaga skermanii]RAJ01664.1 D-alanyl-D-alanine carboxypeptidase-like protein [Chitinophaga skermanii]
MNYNRDPKYMHPYIRKQLPQILAAITAKLPADHRVAVVSAFRTPADQFELYKQGRTFKNGKWVKTGSVVTNIDGYTKLSRHNYLPCTAIDIGIFKGNEYLGNSPLYKHVKQGAKFGFDWGGDWSSFKDLPHLEISTSNLKPNIEKNIAIVWQQYLIKAGLYDGALDGIFGPKSTAALQSLTGESQRNKAAYDKLFDQFGPPENL